MAINKQNIIVEGSNGKIGRNLVFRQKGGTTVMPRRSVLNPDYVASEKQINQRFTFMEAAWYAKNAIENPVLKAEYKAKAKPNQTAYNVAFKDFVTAPILHSVNYSAYTGAIGSKISFRITDVLAVVSVKVGLFDTGGVLIEEGMAVQSALKLDWIYTATVAHTPVIGTHIVVTMTDTPANVYTKEVVIGVE